MNPSSLIHPTGSSPLARGLRRLTLEPAAGSGIIPARAGFTAIFAAMPSPGADHPRSRGVYSIFLLCCFLTAGSSPLARGLQNADGSPSGTPRDHPRSRGVYYLEVPEDNRWRGSSPLARGLPRNDNIPECFGGIIPARAGFTVVTWAWPWVKRDHPRSRGVYTRRSTRNDVVEGSSPLARGLRICRSDRL